MISEIVDRSEARDEKMNPDFSSIVTALKSVSTSLQKGWLDYANLVVVSATFLALVFYTIETMRLRRVAQGQLEKTGKLIEEAHAQSVLSNLLHQTAQEQTKIAQEQNRTAQEQNKMTSEIMSQAQLQNEISIMPMFAVYEDRTDSTVKNQLLLKNVGLGPAFNLTIDKAEWNGESVEFIDADGVMTPGEVRAIRVHHDDGNRHGTVLGVNQLYEWINTERLPEPLRIVIRCVSLHMKAYEFEFNCLAETGHLRIKYHRQSTSD